MRILFVASVVLTLMLAGCKNSSTVKSESESPTTHKPNVYNLPANKSLDKAISEKKMSVVSFTLSGNKACSAADSIFKLASARFPEAKFISVDISLHQDLLEDLRLEAIPAVMVIHENGQRDWHIGPMTTDDLDFAIKEAQDKN